MKKLLGFMVLFISTSSFAVEGYKDIYLDREKTLYIHGITCAPDAKNIKAFRAAIVFSNSKTIEKGTYYYGSAYGNYSYTFSATKNPAILSRGKLKEGQTTKAQMDKNICIIAEIKGLPAPILRSIDTLTLQPNDPTWEKTMVQYAFIAGKPAYAKGVYEDTRTSNKNAVADKKIFDANQQYIKELETIFTKKFNVMSSKLPQKLTDAIKYAQQETGSFEGKKYPHIKEPVVWTPIAKERYNDLSRRRGQRIEWDIIIQKNFDWLFALVGKDNALKSTSDITSSQLNWNGAVLEQIATVQATFDNGKKLALDFLVTTSKVDSDVFATIVDIKKATLLSRTNAIVAYRKEIKPIKAPTEDSLTVYSPTRKTVIFFSDFRAKENGDTYRYQ